MRVVQLTDASIIAVVTPGCVGSTSASLVTNAAMDALRDNCPDISSVNVTHCPNIDQSKVPGKIHVISEPGTTKGMDGFFKSFLAAAKAGRQDSSEDDD